MLLLLILDQSHFHFIYLFDKNYITSPQICVLYGTVRNLTVDERSVSYRARLMFV